MLSTKEPDAKEFLRKSPGGTRHILATTDLDEALQVIARKAQALTLASGAAIALRPLEKSPPHLAAQDEMTCRASAGEDAPTVGARFQVGSGFSGECVREGRLLYCEDSEADSRVDRESCRRLGIRSMVAVPIKRGKSVFGIIEIFSQRPMAFEEDDFAELQGLAERVASAVEETQRARFVGEAKAAVPLQPVVTRRKSVPVPKLLIEPRPAHLVFFDNLKEALSRRTIVPADFRAASEPFWRDVFIDSQPPWGRFLQSALWHLVAVAGLWNLSQGWEGKVQFHPAPSSKTSVTYYRPQSFPSAHGSRPVAVRSPKIVGSASVSRPKIVVPRERSQAAVAAPSVRLGGPLRPKLVAWNPSVPLIPRAPVLAAPTLGSTASQRQLALASFHRPGLPQALAVAPAPGVEVVSGRRALAALGTAVVAPSPSVGFSIRKNGGFNVGDNAVVAPAPGLPLHERTTALAMTLGAGNSIVPPPVSLDGSGALGNGRAGSPSGVNSQVVPPSPTLNAATGSRGMKLGGAGNSVVPPPVSLEGAGSATLAGGRGGSPSGVNSQVVPPSPTLNAATGSGGMSLGGAGSVVPPPVSLEGAGSGTQAGGSGGSLAKLSSQAVPPSPSFKGGTGLGGIATHSAAMMIRPVVAPPQPPGLDEPGGRGPQELPLRLLGFAFALPNSSFFSNYEVYIAEKKIAKAASQLIKLVYEFRPYQHRMSEFKTGDSKVFKLRVIRDASCDETIQQMAGSPDSKLQSLVDYPVLSGDPSRVLPCYRTTADDYRKAISGRH